MSQFIKQIELLEPYDAKVSRTVLRGERGSNASDLPDKIKQIIASGGDYSAQNGCNELTAMRDSLMAHGVPDSVITLDYQGLRTLSSIVKAKDIYNLDSLTIISQKYHNERAIWLAEHYGIHAIAYNASTPDITDKRIKNISREFLARIKMFLDIFTNTQ